MSKLCTTWLFAIVIVVGTVLGTSAQTFTTLVNFDRINGRNPETSPLVQGIDGDFYGTTDYGGNPACSNGFVKIGCGIIFKIDPLGNETVVHRFCFQTNCPDGEQPFGGLTLGMDGDIYGTTASGGSNSKGVVFKLTPSGRVITLYNFCSQPGCSDGSLPLASLTLGIDGSLYGTTSGGGTASSYCSTGCGTVFKITSDGAFTTLHSFDCVDGDNPGAALVQATDGYLYGTTSFGGSSGCNEANNAGTVFRITPKGVFKTLYSFCARFYCLDGANPDGTLIQALDGTLYGTTQFGGTGECGPE